MNKKKSRSSKFETNAVRAGTIRSSQGEHSESLYLTSSFIFESAEEAAERFLNQETGNVLLETDKGYQVLTPLRQNIEYTEYTTFYRINDRIYV